MIRGLNLIDGQWVGSDHMIASDALDGVRFAQATDDQVDQSAQAARRAFRPYAALSKDARAAFLRKIAEEIDILGDEITRTALAETGLPEARLIGERGRTVNQLMMFADLIESDTYKDIRIVEALPERAPLPRPDIRLTHRPIGPVVVFGASNFPLAFSAAGGDTASALAAGCPVIVKGHSAHPGTSELVASAIATAISASGLPNGVFQHLQGAGHSVGHALVVHPEIRAVGFTGSLAGGRALYDLCHSRPTPIPFYGELGSVNPMFLLPGALKDRAAAIGKGWAASLTMGAGQFCTNPGVIVGVSGQNLDTFQDAAVEALAESAPQKMLTDGIHAAYLKGKAAFGQAMPRISTNVDSPDPRHASPAIYKVDAPTWLAQPKLQEEVFGPVGILIVCTDPAEMVQVAERIEGQLTVTLHISDSDLGQAQQLLPVLEEKAGRLLFNGFPTGVEVCSAMMHGGPYPASTDVRATSVGTLAIVRFMRPVAYQDCPANLLHNELKD